MTKLEKMAKEYAKKTVAEDCPLSGDWVNIAHDYKAGFLAAREMAAGIKAQLFPYPNPVLEPKAFAIARSCVKHYSERCSVLGEEEV